MNEGGRHTDDEGFELTMELQGDYRFLVDFAQPGVPFLPLDEPEPLGDGDGPNAAKVLAAAVGNCLSAAVAALRRVSPPAATGAGKRVKRSGT